jgi:hypothetical protein
MRAFGKDYTFLEAFIFYPKAKTRPSMRRDQRDTILVGHHFTKKEEKAMEQKANDKGTATL